MHGNYYTGEVRTPYLDHAVFVWGICIYLHNGKWLSKADKRFLKQLLNVSKTVHPLYLAIHFPIHHYGIHNSGGRCRRPLLVGRQLKAASIMVDGEMNG